jgi:hypothetical protein
MENLIEKHMLRMQKLKLKGQQWIEEQKIKNEINLNKLEAEKSQLNINKDIRELKTEVKQDKAIIKAGTLLNIWGAIGTIISTLLTIAGLWIYFNSSYFKAITFILAITMTQFTVFILAKHDTSIKKHFIQHATKASILKLVLLCISIYGNYTFFTSGRDINFIEAITILALCIAIDVISIYCISISQDFKTLNRNVNKNSLYKGLLGKIIYNCTFKIIKNIDDKYNSNIVMDKDLQIESNYKQDSKLIELSTFVHDKDTELVKNAIANYKDGNICPSTSALMELTELSKNKVIEIKKALEVEGFIKTNGKKTEVL